MTNFNDSDDGCLLLVARRVYSIVEVFMFVFFLLNDDDDRMMIL